MPLALRAQKNWKNFNKPVSYKIGQTEKMNDAVNVYSNQNVLETRNGIARYNSTAFSAAPLSLSFFQDNSETNYILAKDGTILYLAKATGAHTSIKTGLSAATKHKGVTFNNRHIMAIESDGLFQYDGTTFTQLGQAAPTGISVAVSSGGSLADATVFQVGVTFYDSTNGFESNGFESSQVTTASPNLQIDVTSIPSTAANANIDKIRIYLKDVTNSGTYLFITEQNLGTTSYTITDESVSSVTMPTQNAAPIAGGAKYLAVFGQKLVYAGNSTFPSDVFFSRAFIPDAFDQTATEETINMAGNGPITGIATGYYGDSNQSPYLVMFKRNSIELYTEISGSGQQVVISNDIGCISHDTIRVINGDVWFMSAQGWHIISNGRLVQTKDKSNSIDNGDINDIFTKSGYVYELNKAQFGNFFSVYYPTLQHYMTFVSEGSNNSIFKSYNFEQDIGGFRPFEFNLSMNCATLGVTDTGEEIIYLGGQGGYIYTYSINNTVGTDVDSDGNDEAISAFAMFHWVKGEDLESSYNFGPFILRALAQDTSLTVKYFLDYRLDSPTDLDFSFINPNAGFILDVSKLDEGVLGDGVARVRYVGEILKSGQSLLIGVYKEAQGESMGLIEGQLDVSKNGNPN